MYAVLFSNPCPKGSLATTAVKYVPAATCTPETMTTTSHKQQLDCNFCQVAETSQLLALADTFFKKFPPSFVQK